MSDDLVARLRHAWDERERQLDEDERVAREASARKTLRPHKGRGATWRPYQEGGSDGWAIESADGERSFVVGWPQALAQHIARHDPARVLAEVERGRRDIAAKQRILDEYEQAQAYYEQHRAAPAGEVTGLWTAVRALAEAEGLA